MFFHHWTKCVSCAIYSGRFNAPMVQRANKQNYIAPDTERDMVRFTHAPLLCLFRKCLNIEDWFLPPKNVSPWWKNKMAGDRILLLQYLWLTHICIALNVNAILQSPLSYPTNWFHTNFNKVFIINHTQSHSGNNRLIKLKCYH